MTIICTSLWEFVIADINELKVFVDLAIISAGENDMDVDRVACFHDAVLGYSSMLYGLKQDSDFEAFRESLLKLWKALENDTNIPKKLVRFYPLRYHHTVTKLLLEPTNQNKIVILSKTNYLKLKINPLQLNTCTTTERLVGQGSNRE